jgi:SAM-dependent methyltransferase
MDRHQSQTPSPWITRFGPLLSAGGIALDLACGAGRHTRWLRGQGHRVVAVDIDVSRMTGLADDPMTEIIQADLEQPGDNPLIERSFDAIVVANYLYRPLLIPLTECLGPGGVLIYETFAVGNERFGKPSNPDYLLKRGELLALATGRLTVVAYENIEISDPHPAMVQRICARND